MTNDWRAEFNALSDEANRKEEEHVQVLEEQRQAVQKAVDERQRTFLYKTLLALGVPAENVPGKGDNTILVGDYLFVAHQAEPVIEFLKSMVG